MRPVGVEPLFAAAAELVKPDRGERTDQGKTGGQGIEQGEHVIAKGHPGQHETDDRIEQAEEDDVARHRGEVIKAPRQRIPDVGKPDLANRQIAPDCRSRR